MLPWLIVAALIVKITGLVLIGYLLLQDLDSTPHRHER